MKKLIACLVLLVSTVLFAGCWRLVSDEEVRNLQAQANKPAIERVVQVQVPFTVTERVVEKPVEKIVERVVVATPVLPAQASAPAAQLASSASCPVVNGVSGTALTLGMCKYFFGSPMQLVVPANYWADAYLVDQGVAVYGIQPGTSIRTVEMTLKPLSSTAPSSIVPTPSKQVAGQCPTTSVEAESLLGGSAQFWSRPDPVNFPNTWVYSNKGNSVSFRYPGFGMFDAFNQMGVKGPITADIATFKCKN